MFNLKFLEDSLPDFATIQTERSFQSQKKSFLEYRNSNF